MLTKQQKNLLDFIIQERAHSRSPSYTEMQAHLGLASKSGIHRLCTSLEERGFVRRSRRARGLEVIRLPHDAATDAKHATRVLHGVLRRWASDLASGRADAVRREIEMMCEGVEGAGEASAS